MHRSCSCGTAHVPPCMHACPTRLREAQRVVEQVEGHHRRQAQQEHHPHARAPARHPAQQRTPARLACSGGRGSAGAAVACHETQIGSAHLQNNMGCTLVGTAPPPPRGAASTRARRCRAAPHSPASCASTHGLAKPRLSANAAAAAVVDATDTSAVPCSGPAAGMRMAGHAWVRASEARSGQVGPGWREGCARRGVCALTTHCCGGGHC